MLQSASRVMMDIVEPDHLKFSTHVKSLIASYRKAYDLISIGAYKEGSDRKVDAAIASNDMINSFLCQNLNERADYEDSLQRLFTMTL